MADIKHRKIIVNQSKTYQSKKIDVVKKILTSINKNFKVENILGIEKISFNFNIEIPEDDTFDFPNDIEMYTLSDDANLLRVFNDIIWLYLFHKKDFCKKLEQFDHFIQMTEEHEKYEYLSTLNDQIELLDEVIFKSNCQENSFEEFQTLFYSQYGIDLKEYLDKKPFNEEESDEKGDLKITYKEYQVNSNNYKILKNITNLDKFHPENKKIIFNINSSNPIHKLIKSYSSYIEINPLLSKDELHQLLEKYYQIYSEFKEILELFNTDVASPEYDKINANKNEDKTHHKTNPTSNLKSTMPSSMSGSKIITKSMIIFMIMEHYQIDNFETAIRYFNYYLVKKKYQSIQFVGELSYYSLDDDDFKGEPLLDFLDDVYDSLCGMIILKKEDKFNLIESRDTKLSIIKLIKLLKQSL